MELGSLAPSKGQVVFGVKVDDHRFSGRVSVAQLLQITRDPAQVDSPARVRQNPELGPIARLRASMQRLFAQTKRKNARAYAEYLLGVYGRQARDGAAPPIMLYSTEELKTEVQKDEYGLGAIQIPFGNYLVAIDGDTQNAAWFEVQRLLEAEGNDDIRQRVNSLWVPVEVHHGRSVDWARQSFHDLNVYGVKPNAALAIGMDSYDPVTRIARRVEQEVSFFKGRVNMQKRQLSKHDTDVMTVAVLRGACLTTALGISGVAQGNKAVSMENGRQRQTEDFAIKWFESVAQRLGPQIEDRGSTVLSAPAVMSAIGAVGNRVLRGEMDQAKALDELAAIDWTKGRHWEGIAGKISPRTGQLSLGGSKENAYAVYAALVDGEAEGHAEVRKNAVAEPATA